MERRIKGVLSPKASGSITITENGNYDVVDVANAVVDVKPSGTIDITENGEHDVANYEKANVQVQDKNGKYAFDCLQEMIKYRTTAPSPFNNLEYIYNIPEGLDFSNVINISSYFAYCKELKEVPYINTINCTTFNSFFKNCVNLKKIGGIDTSSGTEFQSMFASCNSLEEIPNIDTSNGTNFSNMFSYCNALKKIPILNTRKATNCKSMFASCSIIETIEGIDLINVAGSNLYGLIESTKSLKNLKIYNIKANLTLSSWTWGGTLTLDSILHTIQELIDTGSSKTLSLGQDFQRISKVYVKITSTEPDENGNVKLPFEVCESTDEGAMLITNYVTQKNWSLA